MSDATIMHVEVDGADVAEPEANSDADLARRLALGDEGALAELYDRFASTVHGIAVRVAGDRSIAEEVTQDVFAWVWAQPGRYDPSRGALAPWLATIAYRRAIDAVRRETTRRRAVADTTAERHPSAEDVAIATDLAKRVRAAVAALPPVQRDVVRLLYFEGRTVSELARSLGVPEGTAKTRLRAARRILADRLGTEGLVGTA